LNRKKFNKKRFLRQSDISWTRSVKENKTNSITIRELAELSGFGRSTVSLALRDHPSLPVITREKIKKIAADHGWKENPFVTAAMMHRRSRVVSSKIKTLALVTSWTAPQPWKASHHPKDPRKEYHMISPALIKGFLEGANERGFEVEEFWLGEESSSADRISRTIRQQNIQAIMITPVPLWRRHLSLDWDNLVAATIGYSLISPRLNRVTTNHVHGMSLILENLKNKGYKRPALAMVKGENERVNYLWEIAFKGLREQKFKKSQCKSWIPDDGSWVFEDFKDWYECERPDCIITAGNTDIIKWCQKMNLRIKSDVGVVELYADHASNMWSGLWMNHHRLGQEAANLLINQLLTNERGIPTDQKTIMIEPLWLEGTTV
jgi:LacI family transcriptional regulator